MMVHDLRPKEGSRKKRKRIGRGIGSGHGTYSTRGIKGQKARSGGGVHPLFEGGQTPLTIRLPKLKGFKNISRVEYEIVNVGKLERLFKEGEEVTPKSLLERGAVKDPKKPVKILGDGEITKALKVKAHKFSKSAAEKIKGAGGEVVIIR